jgi:p-cumate 2,3-dioxygenase beta subunit
MTVQELVDVSPAIRPRSRADYEDFLFNEAALLDQWRLNEWLELFTTDSVYEVPTMGAGADGQPDSALFYVADDYRRLQHRVTRLNKRTAHAEWPHSSTVHMVSNVRVVGSDDRGVQVASVFATFRSKHHITDTYMGHINYTITEVGGELRIRSKRVILGMNSLQPQGKISIIL